MSGKRPTNPENRRDRKIASYVTAQEEAAVLKLVSERRYSGVADAIRRGLALLIAQGNPVTNDYLRKDLTSL
jgi:hypothetical protein